MAWLSGLIGALIGASVTTLIHFWKFNRDETTSRIDDLCREAAEVARTAARYWSDSFDGQEVNQRLAEAEILGGQALIDGMYADIRTFLHQSSQELDECMSVYADAASGGTFTELGREVDLERVARCQQAASDLIVALRRAHRQTMPMHRRFQAYRENKARELDMPAGFR